LLTGTIPKNIEFKYIISTWDHPSPANCEWEVGVHNRVLDIAPPNKTIVCGMSCFISDDQWNMEKITFNLYVPKNNQDKYFVTGNLAELGAWKEPKKMKKTQKSGNCGSSKENLNILASNPE
jgi:hypothetical protein